MTEIRRLVLFFRPYSAQLVLGITAAVLVAVAWLYVPRYISSQIDTLSSSGNTRQRHSGQAHPRGAADPPAIRMTVPTLYPPVHPPLL